MAEGEQAQQIREYLIDRFIRSGYDAETANVWLDDLDIFDSFHDFGDQRKMGFKKGDIRCCSRIIDKLVGAIYKGFLKKKQIESISLGELLSRGFEDSIENKIKRRYESHLPGLFGIIEEELKCPAVTISYSQILEDPLVLTALPTTSVKIKVDKDDMTVEETNRVATSLLTYFFNIPEGPQGVFFTYDASVAITPQLMANLDNVMDTGFYVGQIITPQNICDSATTTNNDGVFKDKKFNSNIQIIGEEDEVSNNRTRFVFNLQDNTSNYLSKEKTTFKINKIEGKPYKKQTPYNINYNITLKSEGVEQVVPIPFASDATGENGKSGPSVDYIEKLILNKPIEKATCTNVGTLLEKVQEMYGEEDYNNIKNRILLDIKRSGDHEQANAVLIFNKDENNHHFGIFQTLDILSALYSRILGNPTIFTIKSNNIEKTKYMECYVGVNKDIDAAQLNRNKLFSLLAYVNRIIGMYVAIISTLEHSDLNLLVANLQKYNNFINNDPIKKYMIMIKAADALYSILEIKRRLVFDNNIAPNASIDAKITEIKDKIGQIYGVFGKEMNENILSGFNIIIDDINALPQERVVEYNRILSEFIASIKDSVSMCETYFKTLNAQQVIISENGIPTSINIQKHFFIIAADGKVNKYVDENTTIKFDKSQIKTKQILASKSPKIRENVRGHLIEFIKSLMSADMYFSDDIINELILHIDEQYSDVPATYLTNIINNFLKPLRERVEAKIVLVQQGGGKNNNKNGRDSDVFYNTLNKTLDFISTGLLAKNQKKSPFSIIVPNDLKQYKLLNTFNKNCQTSTPASIHSQYTLISETLFKINTIIRNCSSVDYYTEKDIAAMGGALWIAETFIAVADEFEKMYLELELDIIDSKTSRNLIGVYNHIFVPLFSKFKSMYDSEFEDYTINLSAFSKQNMNRMQQTLEAFGRRLPRGLTYEPRMANKAVYNIVSGLQSTLRRTGGVSRKRSGGRLKFTRKAYKRKTKRQNTNRQL
jgi:hypothetical protein